MEVADLNTNVMNPKIRLVFSGLCAFVADSWEGPDGKDLGTVEVLLLDPQAGMMGKDLCKHFPCVSFVEFDGARNHGYVVDTAKPRSGSALQAIGGPVAGRDQDVLGLIDLTGRRLAISLRNFQGTKLPNPKGGVLKRESMDQVIDLETILKRRHEFDGGLTRRELKENGLNSLPVAARIRLEFGEIGAQFPYGEEVAFYPKGGKPDEGFKMDFFENAIYEFDPESAARIAFELTDAKGNIETIQFDTGNLHPDVAVPRPQFAVSNLCGAEQPITLPVVGLDFAAYYDLTILASVDPEEREVIHRLEGNESLVRVGGGLCAFIRSAWSQGGG